MAHGPHSFQSAGIVLSHMLSSPEALTLGGLRQLTGISFSTLYRTMNDLLERGYVVLADKTKSSVGRRSGLYTVNRNICFVVGVFIGKGKVTVSIANFVGEVMGSSSFLIQESGDDLLQIGTLIRRIDALIEKVLVTPEDRRRIGAVGIGVSGRIHKKDGRTFLTASEIANWDELEFESRLKAHYGVDVYVENDSAVFLACGKKMEAYRQYKNIAFLEIDTGIGASMIIDDKLFFGSHKMAGELRNITLHSGKLLPPISPGADLVSTELSPLERDFGLRGVYKHVYDCCVHRGLGLPAPLGVESFFPASPKEITLDMLDTAAQRGDIDIIAILLEPISVWANLALTLCYCLDPELLLINIGLSSKPGFIFSRLSEIVKTRLSTDVRVAYLDGGILERRAAAIFALDKVHEKTISAVNIQIQEENT